MGFKTQYIEIEKIIINMKDFKYLKTFEQFEIEAINEAWAEADLRKYAQNIQQKPEEKDKLMKKVFSSQLSMSSGKGVKNAINNMDAEQSAKLLNSLADQAKAEGGKLQNIKANIDYERNEQGKVIDKTKPILVSAAAGPKRSTTAGKAIAGTT
jgi:hypothetical protein